MGKGDNATYEVSPTVHVLKAQNRLPSAEHSRPWTSAHAIVKHLTQVIKRQLTLLTEIDTRSALSIILQGRIEFVDCAQRQAPTSFFPFDDLSVCSLMGSITFRYAPSVRGGRSGSGC